jgi:hypothetical protein
MLYSIRGCRSCRKPAQFFFSFLSLRGDDTYSLLSLYVLYFGWGHFKITVIARVDGIANQSLRRQIL